MTCSTCASLSRRLEAFTVQQSILSAAHLRAAQGGDLAKARQLDGSLSDASNGAHATTKKLQDQKAFHRGTGQGTRYQTA
jgi:hypothetical protein